MDKIAILGDGAWGTALSIILSEKIKKIFLWGIDEENLKAINELRENPKFLPGAIIPENVSAISTIPSDIQDYILAIPSKFVKESLIRLKTICLKKGRNWCIATKGIDAIELKTMSQILSEIISPDRIAVLSGPAIAREVVSKMPTALVVASKEIEFAKMWQDLLSNDYLRLYSSDDIRGVELCAALKNIFAIGAGICDGLKLGTNAKSAFITRALVEMSRFVVSMDGKIDTVYGIAGVGDLVTTCFSLHSRNRRFGEEVARGTNIKNYLSKSIHIVEGVLTTKAVVEIADKKGIDMPICRQIYDVIFEGKPPKSAITELMKRPLKQEKISL